MGITLPNLHRLERLVISNSPLILTAVGVLGVVGTAVTTHRAALKGRTILLEADAELVRMAKLHGEDEAPVLSNKQIAKLVWVEYIPPVAIGAITITAIVMSNRISAKRAAAMAAAYTLAVRESTEYREKVMEKLGLKEEKNLSAELAQEQVNASQKNSPVLIVGDGEVMCHDAFTGRSFKANADTLLKAENATNHEINRNQVASLTYFYNAVGLPPTDFSDHFGWNMDQLMKLDISAVLVDDKTPCLSFRFLPHPLPGYGL